MIFTFNICIRVQSQLSKLTDKFLTVFMVWHIFYVANIKQQLYNIAYTY